MIKNILIIISVSMLALACGSNQGSSGKPITKNTPSVNHTKKEGTQSLSASSLLSMSSVTDSPAVLMSMSDSGVQVQASEPTTEADTITTITPAEDTKNNDSKTGDEKVYSVLTRLYNTVWFQTEEEKDNGRVETETTFLFFNSDSKMEERELETGEPDESEYSLVKIVDGITLTTSQNGGDTTRDRNACVVKNNELDDNDTEYQLYYLKDENTLYVIELTEKFTEASKLQTKAQDIIKELEGDNAANKNKYNEDKYALSTT